MHAPRIYIHENCASWLAVAAAARRSRYTTHVKCVLCIHPKRRQKRKQHTPNWRKVPIACELKRIATERSAHKRRNRVPCISTYNTYYNTYSKYGYVLFVSSLFVMMMMICVEFTQTPTTIPYHLTIIIIISISITKLLFHGESRARAPITAGARSRRTNIRKFAIVVFFVVGPARPHTQFRHKTTTTTLGRIIWARLYVER